jgi:phosphomannomutase
VKEFLKVGISGVRGVVGDSFTPQVAADFAAAFGTYVGRGTVLVGHDTRRTGDMIERAVVAGLQSVGCKPLLAGVIPTPTALILTKELNARGGIAITASHNPAQWNALKFIGRDGLFLDRNQANELYDVYHQGEFPLVTEDAIPKTVEIESPMAAHFRKVLDYVDVDRIRDRHFRVAVDCCNGVGAVHTRVFLEQLGCEVTTCCDALNGEFEREPEPLPENLRELSSLVKEGRCDIGFAQDPDGDRLAIVDEQGVPIGEDLTVALAVDNVLTAHETGKVVVHLSTSQSVHWVASQHNCECVRSRIGEINVVKKMLQERAVVGGEGNGGVIVPTIHPCRDSYAGMALILELLARQDKCVSAIRAGIPHYFMVKRKVRMQGEQTSRVLRALRRRHENGRINLEDGVHVVLDDAWFHVRLSNTEPVVRIVTEAPSQSAAEHLADRVEVEMFE